MNRATDGFIDLTFPNHTKRAKRRFRNIEHTANQNERNKLYGDLIKVTEKTVRNASLVAEALESIRDVDIFEASESSRLVCKLKHYGILAQKVIDQTKRRVFYGETVPPRDKVVSIFEPHTDIIVKDRRETYYGHKICLTTGKSGLVLDCVVEDGNPADSTLAVEMVKRVTSIYGTVPRQAAFDGGFASKANLSDIKNLGVKDVAFNKKCGLDISDMVSSTWVYRSLSFFRAGIEGTISFLKRCFGMGRCMWKGLESFKSYTWASIISHNLLILARHSLN
jgi:IS5 family transposase